MSKEIICPECQTANTPGSKFCNNCGSQLPASTSLICPNCSTPNPRDRFYCDNCGSRLVKDKQVPRSPEEKPESQTGSFFSLPARPPGQTGELDPLQIVPDWLKKQAEEDEGEEDEEDLRLRMPKIEGIGSPKKVTDDLPDWLVDDDSEEIIGSPRIITTEHYMKLVEPTESEDEELNQTADKANLPDWLSDLASPDTEDKVTHSDDLSTPDDALNEWLSSISGSGQEKPATIEPDDLSEQLAGLDQSDDWAEQDEPEGETQTNWLFENNLEAPEADLALSDPDSLSGLEADESVLGDDMFDWLAQNLVDTGSLDPAVVADSQALESGADDDWLADFTAADTDEELAPADDEFDDFTDLFHAADGGALAELTDAVAQQDIGSGDQELPDWVSEIRDQDAADSATSESQPDWMAEFTTADSESFAEEIESRLGALDDGARSETVLPEEEENGFAADATDEVEMPEVEDLADAALVDEPEELPDWLTDLGGEGLVAEQDGDENIFTDLFAPVAADSDDLDWIVEEEPAAQDDLLSASDEVDELEPSAVPETDWLSEMVRLGDDAFVDEESGEVDTAVADQLEPDEEPADIFAADWPDQDADEDEPEEATLEPDVSASDWMMGDSLLVAALDDEMPDWLDELGASATGEADPPEDETDLATESMPDWIAQMKPGSGFGSTGLRETGGLPDLTDPYANLPDGIVGSELPGWLQDADEAAVAPVPPLSESTDIPEWLAESIPSESGSSGQSGKAPESDDEWMAVLQGLPPAAPIEERVFKADVPEWILALKPSKISDEDEAESRVQEEGPLSGIRDVIEIEPIIAESRSNGTPATFAISPEQLSQAALLKQLALADKGVVRSSPGIGTSSRGMVRLVLAGLLFATILLGLMRPNLLRVDQLPLSNHLAMGYAAIEAAAGQPVLLAVEYTPALSGELDAQLEMILAQLAAAGSPVITVSQSAAGTAVIQRMAGDSPTLGLLPGQSIGLRQLGDCLGGETSCNTLAGKTVNSSLQQSLDDVALIIVLTGERDRLVEWLEQVALTGDIPVVAGVTQSLAPVALPYLDTQQLRGMIGGLPETAVYQQQLLNQTPDETMMRQLSAQTWAQLLAAILLLTGGLVFGISNLLQRDGKR